MEIKHSKKEFVNNISTTMLRDLYINNAELNGYTFYNVNEDIQVGQPLFVIVGII